MFDLLFVGCVGFVAGLFVFYDWLVLVCWYDCFVVGWCLTVYGFDDGCFLLAEWFDNSVACAVGFLFVGDFLCLC